MEIVEELSGCNDQTIVKGKRSKRLRSSSSSASASSSYNSLTIDHSPEEDEDMANCLILLARGGGSQATETKPTENDKFTASVTAAAISGARVGVYVYECKTCSRTFPSFQALGGHRASHKKPKIVVVDADRKKSPGGILLRLENKSRIHECSVCGSEFASGQALGGHMRRHRSTKIIDSTDEFIINGEEEEEKKKRIMLALDLDLNLPAPTEDDHHRRQIEMEFRDRFFSAGAALVDCHY